MARTGHSGEGARRATLDGVRRKTRTGRGEPLGSGLLGVRGANNGGQSWGMRGEKGGREGGRGRLGTGRCGLVWASCAHYMLTVTGW